MKSLSFVRHSFASVALLIAALPSSFAQADDTGWISPQSGNGFYNQWVNSMLTAVDMGSYVNDGIGCDPASLSTFWIIGTDTARQSAIITIPGTIPDGSTIDSVDVQVCQSRGGAGSDGATFQTFIRIDGADTNSGTNITAATPAGSPTANTQNIPVGIVMTGSAFSDLEVGTQKTNAVDFQRIHTLAARINYTIPGSTTIVSCTTPINVGDTSSCTATVAPGAGSTTPTGSVTWATTDAGSFSGQSCTPGVGSLSCSATFTPAGIGTPTVTATFAGDANMTGSNGSDDVVISILGSTTTVSCASPIEIGNTSSCTATIAPSAGSTTPTGAVTWTATDAGSFSGETCTPGAGTLSCNATYTPAGAGTVGVTATYAGDANMTGSSGADAVQVNDPIDPTAPTPVPVFGPLGTLLTLLGMGMIGGWYSRRRR